MRENDRPDGGHRPQTILVAALTGLGAGLIASFVMERVQAIVPAPDTGDADPATEVAATRLHEALTGAPLLEGRKAGAGALVHYALGGALGATYGVVARFWPAVTRGGGVPFGFSTALVLDEIVVPALGLTKPPWRYTAETHAFSMMSHAVFGVSLEAARRSLLAASAAVSTDTASPSSQSGPPQASRTAAV